MYGLHVNVPAIELIWFNKDVSQTSGLAGLAGLLFTSMLLSGSVFSSSS